MSKSLQNRAMSFFQGMSPERKDMYSTCWNIAAAKAEEIAIYSVPSAQKSLKELKKPRPQYEVHHFIAVARNRFYELMLMGKCPTACLCLCLDMSKTK